MAWAATARARLPPALPSSRLVSFIRRSHDDTDSSWPYGIDPNTLAAMPTGCGPLSTLPTAVYSARRRATTTTPAWARRSSPPRFAAISALIVASVGDSRLYLLANGDAHAADRGRHVGGDDARATPGTPIRRRFANHPMRQRAHERARRARADRRSHSRSAARGWRARPAVFRRSAMASVDDAALRIRCCTAHGAVDRTAASRSCMLVHSPGTRDNVTALVILLRGRGVSSTLPPTVLRHDGAEAARCQSGGYRVVDRIGKGAMGVVVQRATTTENGSSCCAEGHDGRPRRRQRDARAVLSRGQDRRPAGSTGTWISVL